MKSVGSFGSHPKAKLFCNMHKVPNPMTDLIRRLEDATVGSRELSDEVLVALGWSLTKRESLYWINPKDQAVHMMHRPSPTEDLTDAVAAIEEGHWCRLIIATPARAEVNPNNIEGSPIVVASTPELAVTIANLKARQAEEG